VCVWFESPPLISLRGGFSPLLNSERGVNVEKIVKWFESGRAEDLANWLALVVFGCLFFVIGSCVVALIVR
jgi:hypothetical protein